MIELASFEREWEMMVWRNWLAVFESLMVVVLEEVGMPLLIAY